ncbi:hypothetical protein HPB52_013670 [Rhipicephalus sanguineus]|uniref:Uncharacterized protein n=1 Tax=Rhipicephalus sanguineus TaxID=34632 RepID=A0A9D4SQG7_RHISA|nr:hypothetical protein HPB52_013670 [Rhipicephalus sanguineus]
MLAYSYSFTLLFIDLEPVEHWCASPEQFANLSEQLWKDTAIPRDSNGDFKQCERYDPLEAPALPLATSTFRPGGPVSDHLEASTQSPVTIDRTNASEVRVRASPMDLVPRAEMPSPAGTWSATGRGTRHS